MILGIILLNIILFLIAKSWLMFFNVVYLFKITFGDKKMDSQPIINSNLIRGHIETIILHSLLNGDKYPQQICDSVFADSNCQYEMNQATLYSSLKRLETLKYVNSYWFGAEDGRRKYYSITEKGKSSLEGNLSEWAYSRAIIDKLIGSENSAQKEVVTVEKIVEKIVEKPVYIGQKIEKETEISNLNVEKISESNQNIVKENQNSKEEDSNKEINFRYVLGDLINSSKPKHTENIQEKRKITLEKLEIEKNTDDSADFNQSITKENVKILQKNGNIDLTDVKILAEKQGVKLRISSDKNKTASNSIYINKVKLYASLSIFLLLLLEFLLFTQVFKTVLSLNFVAIFMPILIAFVSPVINIINYLKNPKKLRARQIKADIILTSAIIVFNLILVNFAVILISGINLSDLYSLFVYFIVPSSIFFDVFVYFIIKYILSTKKSFKIKNV